MKITEILAFIRDLIADEAKMRKFREIVADIKELVCDIRDAVTLIKG